MKHLYWIAILLAVSSCGSKPKGIDWEMVDSVNACQFDCDAPQQTVVKEASR